MSFYPPTAGQPSFGSSRQPSERMHGAMPGLILIALGLSFFIGHAFNVHGATIFIAIGLAFLIGRVLSGNYGLAVPAGILLGFGSYVALEETRLLPQQEGAWFFLMLALGFLAVYAVGARPAAVWPLFPAAVLAAIGIVMLGWATLLPLAPLAWTASFWPAVLVLIGLWLLGRDLLPGPTRAIAGTVGFITLLLYGILAVAATVAAASTGADTELVSRLGRLGAPLTETVSLSTPIGEADTLTVRNSSGRTTIRRTEGGEARVQATKHLSPGQQIEVALQPGPGGVSLEARTSGSANVGTGARVDYDIQLPAGAAVSLQTSSGAVDLSGLTGRVQVDGSSGTVRATGLSGTTTIHTSSGSIRLTDISGDLRVSSSSGSIRAMNVSRLVEATSTSGRISLDGRFSESSLVRSGSGDVEIGVRPGSAEMLDVRTTSGSIRTRGLALADQQSDRRSLRGTVGEGGNTLRIETSSGDVTLSSSR